MNQYHGEVPSFSILDVMRGMGRRKALMLSSLAFGALVGFGVVSLISPKYQAEARVLVDNFATPYDSANVSNQDSRDTPIDERTITSQVAVLQSEDLGRRVVTTLSLTDKAEFDPMKKGLGLLKQLLIRTGFADDPRLMTVEQRAYNQLSGALTVYPIPQSNVIGVKYTAGDGEIAASVANTLAETYVLSTRETRSGDTGRAREWLSSQIDGLRQKVAESDGAVEKYRAEAGLLKGESSTLGAQEISELNTQITLAEAARSEAEAKADEIRDLLESQGSVEASSEVLASSTIQRLREQQVTSEQKYNELSATYLPNHPKMLAAKKDINDIERRIRREALKVVDGLQGQAKIAQARANSLRKSLEALKSREGSAILDEVRLKELEREAKANRDQLEVMLSRFADSNTRQNLELQPGFARVIQTATAPASPYFPRIGPILLLASLAGLAFGVGLAFLLEIMAQAARMNEVAMAGGEQPANRVRHPAREAMQQRIEIPKLDVTQSRSEQGAAKGSIRSGGNVAPAAVYLPTTLASVPQARSGLEASSLLAALSAGGAMQNSVTQLSQHLQTMHNNGSLKGCAIANLGGAHEVPTMALALGRHLADSGLKTILVDLEAQHSILPDLMALADAPGLTELLTGTSDFSRAIQRDRVSGLQFVRHGSFEVSVEAQLQQRMETITKTLTGIYDVVLLHVGEASPAMLQLAKGCESVLIYAPAHRKKDANAAAATLNSKGFKDVFLVQIDGQQQAAA